MACFFSWNRPSARELEQQAPPREADRGWGRPPRLGRPRFRSVHIFNGHLPTPFCADRHARRVAGATVFLTGCGRSGTTILGTVLSQHPDVAYLNDRFDVWIKPLPVTDIWNYSRDEGRTASARVALGAADADPGTIGDGHGRINEIFERERGGKRVLVEKLAINNFRLPFLHALFPEARFINIVRHGVEVARSIARKIEAGEWYGHGDRKWSLLEAHATEVGLGALLPLCTGPFEKGLLEWRMSVDAAGAFFQANPGVAALHVRYEGLVADPSGTCDRLARFLGLASYEPMRDWAVENIARQSPRAEGSPVPDTVEPIAGEALRKLGYQAGRVRDLPGPVGRIAPPPVGPGPDLLGPVFNRPVGRTDRGGAP
jgi:hypothetical protein